MESFKILNQSILVSCKKVFIINDRKLRAFCIVLDPCRKAFAKPNSYTNENTDKKIYSMLIDISSSYVEMVDISHNKTHRRV